MLNKLFAVLILLSLMSCMVTEEIVFNDDYSGKISYNIDMSKTLEAMGDKFGKNEDSNERNKSEGVSNNKKIDSVFTFKELLADKKDSIAKLPYEEQEKIKRMEKFTFHMVMDEENKIFTYDMYSNFKSPEELQYLVSPVNTLSAMNSKAKGMGDLPSNDGVTKYTMKDNIFEKNVQLQTKEQIEEEFVDELNDSETDLNEEEVEKFATDMTKSMEAIFQMSEYTMKVTFPKKIKNVSVEDSEISDDKKSILIKYPLDNYMKSLDMNFKVELEK